MTGCCTRQHPTTSHTTCFPPCPITMPRRPCKQWRACWVALGVGAQRDCGGCRVGAEVLLGVWVVTCSWFCFRFDRGHHKLFIEMMRARWASTTLHCSTRMSCTTRAAARCCSTLEQTQWHVAMPMNGPRRWRNIITSQSSLLGVCPLPSAQSSIRHVHYTNSACLNSKLQPTTLPATLNFPR